MPSGTVTLGPGLAQTPGLVSSFQTSASQLGAAPPGLPPAEEGWGLGRRDRSRAGRAQGPDHHPPPVSWEPGLRVCKGVPKTLPPAQVTEKARLAPHSGRAALQQPRASGDPARGIQISARLENPRSWG